MEPGQRGKRIVLAVNSPPVAIPTDVDENTLEEELDVLKRAQTLIALNSLRPTKTIRHATAPRLPGKSTCLFCGVFTTHILCRF